MDRIRIALLGGLDVRLPSGQAMNLSSRKAQGLLAYLALRPGQFHTRDKLATLLWGDASDERARHSLRQALLTLRRSLAAISPGLVVVAGDTLAVDASQVEVDQEAFERLAAEGTYRSLEAAASLYRGEFLEGLHVTEPAFQEWVAGQRVRLRERAVEVLARLLQHQRGNGEVEPAIQTALRLLRLDRTQEVVHRTLIQLYARQGRRAEALRQYRACVGVLRGELGVEPEPETVRLYREILRPQVAPRPLAGQA